MSDNKYTSLNKFTDMQLLHELSLRNGVHEAPNLTRRHTEHFETLVAIGKDNTASIIMSAEAADFMIKELVDQKEILSLVPYKCHKEVQAMQIARIEFDHVMAKSEGRETDGSALLYPFTGSAPIKVGPQYLRKHKPMPDGYYVLYEDGYESFSPRHAFEDGYLEIIE